MKMQADLPCWSGRNALCRVEISIIIIFLLEKKKCDMGGGDNGVGIAGE